MRYVAQQKKTGKFVEESGETVKSLKTARRFGSFEEGYSYLRSLSNANSFRVIPLLKAAQYLKDQAQLPIIEYAVQTFKRFGHGQSPVCADLEGLLK